MLPTVMPPPLTNLSDLIDLSTSFMHRLANHYGQQCSLSPTTSKSTNLSLKHFCTLFTALRIFSSGQSIVMDIFYKEMKLFLALSAYVQCTINIANTYDIISL